MTTVLVRAVNLISIPIFTRLLATSDYGSCDVFFSASYILYFFFGLSAFSIVERAFIDFKQDINKYMSTVMSMTLIHTLIITLFVNALCSFYPNLRSERASLNALILYSYMLFITTYKVSELNYKFQYKTCMFYILSYVIANVVLSILFILTDCFSSAYWDRINGALFPTAIAGIGAFLLYQIRGGWSIKKQYIQYTLKYAVPLIPNGISLILLSNADRIMIKYYYGATYAAIYAVTYTSGILLTVAIEGINKVYLPVFFRKMEKKEYKDVTYYQKIIIFGMCALSVLMLSISPEVTVLFGGAAYKEGQQFVNWIILATFINFLYTIYYNIEYYHKKVVWITTGTIISTAINIVLNFIFLPICGYQFGAVSTIAAYVFLLLMHMLITRKTIPQRLLKDRFVIFILIAMLCVTSVMQFMIGSFVVRIITGILTAGAFALCILATYKKALADSVKFRL